MRVVDVNVLTGPGDRVAIPEAQEAWVVDRRACIGDPMAVDADALAGLPGPGLRRPQLVAMPGPLDVLEARVAAYRGAGGPSVLRVCPGPEGHGYPLEAWVLSPLPEYCDRERIVLLVDPAGERCGFPWSAIVRLAQAYPSLPTVALGAPLASPAAGPALDAAANLVLETSGVTSPDAVAALGRLAGAHGPHRLTYGSGETAVVASVIGEAVGAEAMEAVLSGTAELLGSGTWGSTWL